jgi:hypothetical protein
MRVCLTPRRDEKGRRRHSADLAPVEEVQFYVRDASGKRVDVPFHDLIDQSMGKSRCVPISIPHLAAGRYDPPA